MTRTEGTLDILLIDPFFGGSHRSWGEQIMEQSRHQYHPLTLEGRFWKWRMRGGSMILAEHYLRMEKDPDLILCSSMLDLPSFIARIVTSGRSIPPLALYFHENQFLYPLPDEERPLFKEQRKEFGSMNWRSALVADRIFFNSNFHRREALKAFEDFVRKAPDHNDMDALRNMEERSTVYPPAPDLLSFDGKRSEKGEKDGKTPVLLWNHRWEAEKGPEEFSRIVSELMEERKELELMLLGECGSADHYRKELKIKYPERVLKAEAISSRQEYLQALARCDLTLVSSHQDFFGISVVEAMYNGVVPVLPDRLAYPEHLPDELAERLLYHSPEEAKEIALSLIDGELRVPAEELRSAVEAYDVRHWIDTFDEELLQTARPPLP